MKKRVLAVLLAGMMAASMAACGSKAEEAAPAAASSEAAASEAAEEEATEEAAAPAEDADGVTTISFIVSHTDGHFIKVMAGAQAYADEHDGVEVEFSSPTSATMYDEQLNMIETALTNDSIDALCISPLQSQSTTTLVAGSKKPIIAFNADFDAPEKSSFVGTGNYDAAYAGGDAAAKAAIAKGVEHPVAVILTGAQGDETHEARQAGYTDGVVANGGEVVEVQYCDSNADKAATAMEAVMQKYQDGVDIVLVTDDNSGMAVVKVFQDNSIEAYKDTIVGSFDGNQVAIEAIQSGALTQEVAQLGYDMGYKAMETICKVLAGEKVEEFVDSGSLVVTADNAEEYAEDLKSKGLWE